MKASSPPRNRQKKIKTTSFQKDTFDSCYLDMREKQTKILYEMFKAARALHTTPTTAPLFSDFLEKVSNEYHKDNDVKALLEELALIHDKMKAHPLPPDPQRVRSPRKSFYLHGTSQRILTDKTRFYDCAKQQDVTSLKFYFIFYPTKSALSRL